ncbi:unnamed protein product [Rhizoctonia solani]|uniref:Zn(2)-C6 fungal-type domain-containing protein n=1 Tax=Rhizoctonia solani TaxID=456999 RepID=A0A8H3E8Q1_9AGAM|nr:unnamed protein product [Rhizoctonia solani]
MPTQSISCPESTKATSSKCRNRPGPRGTSCLTCKQRHKKCDQRLPLCERCEKGGFECLGYYHNSDRRVTSISHHARLPQRLVMPSPTYTDETSTSTSSLRSSPLEIDDSKESEGYDGDSALILGSNLRSSNHESTLQLFPKHAESPLLTFHKLFRLCTQIPSSPSDPLSTFLSNPIFDDYIWAQRKINSPLLTSQLTYAVLLDDALAKQWYFKPSESQKKGFQKGIRTRLCGSLATVPRWITLIDMGICEDSLKGDTSQSQLHNLWITYIENALRRELSYSTTPQEAQEHRSDWIHISILKTMVIHSSHTYQILRNITPAFLQVVFSDPTLWPRDCDPTYIPLSNILCSDAYELSYFALMDCTCAMALGLPQQLEYDTTIHPQPNKSPFHQWANGCPTEFQLVLAEINACRDKSPNARDWRDIESWLLAWQSRADTHVFTESWMAVAWYAVQESWRLALLAYLYMAVCNTSSDDPRVQACVTQILPVIGTVKRRGSSGAEVSFFVQYLMAGICARKEAHRKIVRDTLAGTKEPKFWLMRGSDFVPVLDHLWHGAGSGGGPVWWRDYVLSREATLPVAQ